MPDWSVSQYIVFLGGIASAVYAFRAAWHWHSSVTKPHEQADRNIKAATAAAIAAALQGFIIIPSTFPGVFH